MTVTTKEPSYKSDINDQLVRSCISTALRHGKSSDTSSSGKVSVFADASKAQVTTGTLRLDVVCFKVPMAEQQLKRDANRPLHPKIYRLPLTHTLTDASSGVLLVTKDYPKPGKGNFKLSNDYFLQKITAAGCNHLISEIMCLSQLRDEYSENEARQDLGQRIDTVICDTAVVKVVPRLLGKNFNSKGKFPVAVKLTSGDLLKEISTKLGFGTHKMTFKNTQSSFVFGRAEHGEDKCVANLHCGLSYLSTKFPGGWANVKSLHVTLGLRSRVPLYISTGSSADVPSLVISPPESEIVDDDIGFGRVKMTIDGTILYAEKCMNYKDGEFSMRPQTVRRKFAEERREDKKQRRLEDQQRKLAAKKKLAKAAKRSRTVSSNVSNETEGSAQKHKNKKMKKMYLHTTPVEEGI